MFFPWASAQAKLSRAHLLHPHVLRPIRGSRPVPFLQQRNLEPVGKVVGWPAIKSVFPWNCQVGFCCCTGVVFVLRRTWFALKFDTRCFEGVAFSKAPDFCILFWSNYSDLTRPGPPKWWFSKGNPLISGKSRLVKYYSIWPDLMVNFQAGLLAGWLMIEGSKREKNGVVFVQVS